MKLESTLEKIEDAVLRVQKVSAKNISLPILENVLLIAEDNTLKLRSTNLHIGVEITLPVKIEKPGRVAVRLDIFSQIITNLKNEHKVVLEVTDNILNIITEKSQMEIKLFPDADFPTLPYIEDAVELTIPVDTLIEGVRSVMYSASVSEIKPEISSVYIYTENNELVFVATDSFRLSEKRIVAKGVSDFPGLIVPIKNIQECIKIFTGINGDLKVFISKNQISIASENIYFTSRIIDGNYPDYKQIIPVEFKTEAVVLKDELMQSLRLVNVFSDNFNQILLQVKKGSGALNINSRNTDIGENNTSVDAAVTGEDIDIYINHKYLSDAFGSFSGDSLTFYFSEKNKPCLLRGVGDNSFVYLIMPMNR